MDVGNFGKPPKFEHGMVKKSEVQEFAEYLNAFVDRIVARAYSKLDFIDQQRVFVLLNERKVRGSKDLEYLDKSVCEEVINDAKRGIYIYKDWTFRF